MQFDPSDILFLVVVLSIAVLLINNSGGGGGHRAACRFRLTHRRAYALAAGDCSRMPSAIVIGGGLAGLASAAALGGAGFQVDLFESRGFLGGRATSYLVPGDNSEVIDNCQHVLLRCCVNLMDFYRRLGVADRIQFHKRFNFIEPGGRTSDARSRARCLRRCISPEAFGSCVSRRSR